MNRNALVLFVILVAGRPLFAQKYGISLELGQHYGINRSDGNDAPFAGGKYYSMGAGVTRQLMFHVFPDSSNWYFSCGLSHLGGNNVITAEHMSDAKTWQSTSRTLHSLRVLARFSYVFNIRSFGIHLSAGVLFPVISNSTEEYRYHDSTVETLTTSHIRNYTTLGFNGAIGISKNISKGIKFFLHSDLNILGSHVRSKKITDFQSSAGTSLETAYPTVASRETVYKRDRKDIRNNEQLPAFNKDKPTDKLSYYQAGSSIGFQVGFLFLF